MLPKSRRRVVTVRKVAHAITAELKSVVKGRLLTRSEEQNPSTAASRTAASPP
jgi:hypothetical protein